ncbi:MAG: YfhO family protein [Clostridiaceae bacterium]|nr:YfhO family protein [Clostridiaceae bacterium]
MNLIERRQRRTFRRDSLIAFALPLLIFYISYAFYGLFPFGNRHLLTIDLYHQYAPFLVDYGRKLRSFESLFFSWSGGLGTSFYPLFTYYLASPVNLIMLVFPRAYVSEAVLVITLVKIGLMGASFHCLLNFGFRKKDRSSIIFASFYALSNFVLAYSWNIMWLDTLIIFPLAILGLIRLVRHGERRLYLISLAVMLMLNYYSAFFACVFIALYALLLLTRYMSKGSWQIYFSRLGQIIGLSLLAVMLAAVVLLPTVKALSITSAAGDAFPRWGNFSDSMLDLMGQLEILREPNVMSGLPNIYVGLLPLLLLPYFFLSKGISRKAKIGHAGLIGFLFVSFYSAVLDFIWHGLHYPNSLDYRYAFVLVLLLLMMAYQALPEIRRQGPAPALGMAMLMFALVLLREWNQNQTGAGKWRVLATLILLGLYIIVLSRRSGRPSRPAKQPFVRLGTTALLLVMLFELLTNVTAGISDLQQRYPLGDRIHYTDNERAREISSRIEEIKDEKGRPYTRFEILPDTTVNDAMLFSTNGFSIFSSTFQEAPIDFLEELGFPTNGVNSFQYKESNIFMDSIMGIEYLFRPWDTVIQEDIRTELAGGSNYKLYRNDYALPFGFFVAQTTTNINVQDLADSPYAVQNRLSYLMGGSEQIFEHLHFSPWLSEGAYVEERGISGDQFYARSNDSDWAFLYTVAPESGSYYLAWDDINAGIKNVNGFLRDGTDFFHVGGKTNGMIDLGYVEAGDTIHFRVNLGRNDQTDGEFKAYLVRLNQPAFEETIAGYKSASLKNLQQGSHSFKGTVQAPEQGFVFIPTFVHPGWKVKVDNEPVEVTAIRDSFMLITVSAGEHQIEAKFTPPGFYAGLLISLLTAGACLLYLIRRRKQGKSARYMNIDLPTLADQEKQKEKADQDKKSNSAHKMRKTQIHNSIEQ